MVDDDHAASCEPGRKRHHTDADGLHLLAARTSQVHPAMPGTEVAVGRVEGGYNGGCRAERPHPALIVSARRTADAKGGGHCPGKYEQQ